MADLLGTERADGEAAKLPAPGGPRRPGGRRATAALRIAQGVLLKLERIGSVATATGADEVCAAIERELPEVRRGSKDGGKG